ncbi:MAG: amidohydrolase family protein [Candidatus Rokubacteria bacterium]|nr:amidohydrolase family protein [Candidatus Rokubacteria bacterium]
MIVTARRLLDGMGAAPLTDAAVIIRGERIHWVGPASNAPRERGEPRLDLGDVTLLPGLIDMHNHLRINHADRDLAGQMRDPDVAYVLQGVRNLETNLRAGVTTMKLNGDRGFLDVQMREAVKAGLARGPHLFVAGKGIKSTRCTGGVVATAICDGPEAVRQAVRENVAGGADVIKIFASGGILGPQEKVLRPAYGAEEIRAAVEEAHGAGRMIVAHCHGGPAADACIQAGVDILEHGWLLSREQLARMAERKTWLCVTLGVLLHPHGAMSHQLEGPQADQVRRRLDEVQAVMAEAVSRGVRYVLGTDAVHGGLAFELQALGRLGARPADLLRAATSQAAQALGQVRELGVISPGACADLIAVLGDPLVSLTSLDRVRWVMQGGQVQWSATEASLS